MPHHQVVLFLRLVAEAHRAHRLTYRRSREKNRETLEQLGWRPSDMYECVATLKAEQALSLPRSNQNEAHGDERVCEFGTVVDGHDIYVKVTVLGNDNGPAGCVISFHFAERPLAFLAD